MKRSCALLLVAFTFACDPAEPGCTPGHMLTCEDPAEGCRGYRYCGPDGRLTACECELAQDAGASDTDAGPRDAGADDSGPSDAGSRDAATDDAGFNDAGLPDAGPTDAGVCTAPSGGFGPNEGDSFAPLTLGDCEGTPFDFYTSAGGICDADFTVLVIHAGWCADCRSEASELQAMVADAYAARGVNVVTALVLDDDWRAPDASFCRDWVTAYGLRSPVLLDPTHETGIYFPAALLPAFVIVDRDGVIRRRRYGYSEGPQEIRDALRLLVGS
ncbi:MAG: redoxin domain-containing protein [Sandaracinaceae bacterium]